MVVIIHEQWRVLTLQCAAATAATAAHTHLRPMFPSCPPPNNRPRLQLQRFDGKAWTDYGVGRLRVIKRPRAAASSSADEDADADDASASAGSASGHSARLVFSIGDAKERVLVSGALYAGQSVKIGKDAGVPDGKGGLAINMVNSVGAAGGDAKLQRFLVTMRTPAQQAALHDAIKPFVA